MLGIVIGGRPKSAIANVRAHGGTMRDVTQLIGRDRILPLEKIAGSAACVILPTMARLTFLEPLGAAIPFATYFPTILIATLFWGTTCGVVVLALSGLIADLLFLHTSNVDFLDSKGLVSLALYLACGGLIVFTGHALRRALSALRLAQAAEKARKGELQHRLKNTLAIVQSFSAYFSRRTSDVGEYHRLLEAKVIALAKANEILFGDQFEACRLPDVAEAALAPFAEDERLSVDGPAISLDPDCCEPLALALHELATNAHKHGSLSAASGRVELSRHHASADGSKCIIRWEEKGGPIVQAPARFGLGQRLLSPQRTLESVTVRYEPTGVVCELVAPLAR